MIAFAAAVLAPLANALGAYARGWVPYGDEAIIATRAYDVGTRLTPLLGMPSTFSDVSRFNPSQPGPLQFWVLAPFVRLLGPAAGLLVGTAAVNGAAIAVVGAVLWRRLSRGAALLGMSACLVASIFADAIGYSFRSINSIAPLLPFVATIVLAWAVADGGLAWLAPLFAFGSFAAQGDLEYLGVVLLVVAWALATAAVTRRRIVPQKPTHRGPVDRLLRNGPWSVALAAFVLVLCWMGPIIEAARHHGGNLRQVVDAFFAPTPLLGLTGSSQAVGAVLDLPPFTIIDHSAASWERGLNLTAVVPCLIAVAVSWQVLRRSNLRMKRLMWTAGVLLLVTAANGYRLPRAAFDPLHTGFAQGAFVFIAFAIAVAAYESRTALRVPPDRLRVAVGILAGVLVIPVVGAGAFSFSHSARSATIVAIAGVAVLIVLSVTLGHKAPHFSRLSAAGIALLAALTMAIPPRLSNGVFAWSNQATPALTSQILGRLPRSDQPPNAYLVLSGGGEQYRLEFQGVVAQLRAEKIPFLVQNSYASAYGVRRTFAVNRANTAGAIVVLPAFATQLPPGARLLAEWNPPGWSRADQRDLDRQIDNDVRDAGGITLTSVGASRVGETLRFAVPGSDGSGTPDVTTYRADPRRLLDVPGALTAMYQDGWIASPSLPDELQRRVKALNEHGMSIAVWYLPGPLRADAGA